MKYLTTASLSLGFFFTRGHLNVQTDAIKRMKVHEQPPGVRSSLQGASLDGILSGGGAVATNRKTSLAAVEEPASISHVAVATA